MKTVKNMLVMKYERTTRRRATFYSLPLDGGGLGRGWQADTTYPVFTLPLSPSRQGRGFVLNFFA